MRQLEIAAFNLASALIAQQNGAGRIELCKNMEVGGLTPEADALALAKEQLFVPVFAMVRPRAGNFVYDEAEFAQMLQTILAYKELGADGFVFGILTADNKIDVARNKILVAAANPLPCTFHRAFDAIIEWRTALEELIDCGFRTVLTSGIAADVNSGIHNLKQMVAAAGNNIEIMPGGGLRAANLQQIMEETGARFFHSSAVLNGDTADGNEIQDMIAILEA
ncbi:MAG: copper homeostasis protein CutC [Sphingobacteriales bacterium]|nr:MAG: copper homeostasis protein CutC [Sphingobacteriales bacterium]